MMTHPVVLWRLLVFYLLFSGCANIVPPPGGPKDETPPQIVEANPPSFSTNFSGDEIYILFDEYVNVSSAETDFIFSPPFIIPPEKRVRGKSITFSLKESLKENTTYTIDFSKAVSDITENNVLEGYKYVFSTGVVIDSMRIAGNVGDAFTGKDADKVWVMLYPPNIDSAVYKGLPLYIGRTGTDGQFQLSYLKPGTYAIYALNDKNANRIFDLPDESVAFLDSSITVGGIDTAITVALELFTERPDELKIISHYSARPGIISLVFTKPAAGLIINSSDEIYSVQTTPRQDTAHVWMTQNRLDSTTLFVQAGNFLDTVQFKFGRVRDTTIFSQLKYTANLTRGGILNIFQPLKLTFGAPVKFIDKDKIRVMEQIDTLTNPINADIYFADSAKLNLIIDFQRKDTTSYTLFIPDSAIQSIYNTWNDTISLKLKTTKADDYGKLIVNASGLDSASNYIVELYSGKDILVHSEIIEAGDTTSKVNWSYLLPGQYRLRIIEDKNSNERWDSGIFSSRTKPEKVINSEAIEIKANWENEIEVDIESL